MREPPSLQPRELHVILIVDCSSSISVGGKVKALNTAIDELLQVLIELERENPHFRILLRAVKFCGGADWHVAEAAPLVGFKWPPLSAFGTRDMGAALAFVSHSLTIDKLGRRGLPPAHILISGGGTFRRLSEGIRPVIGPALGRES